MSHFHKLSLTVIAVAASNFAFSGNDAHSDHDEHQHESGMTQLGSHEHGSALLTIASEKNEVWVNLESPAANIVGFEHQVNTPEQQATVEHAEMLLNKGIIQFSGGECTLMATDIHSPFKHDEHEEHHDDHEEHHDDHEEHHDDHEEHHDDHEEHHDDHEEHHDDHEEHHDDHEEHHDDHEEHHDEHEEHHDDHEEHGAEHSEYEVSWQYKCNDVHALNTVEVVGFSMFKGIENLTVQYLMDDHQGAVELTPKNNKVSF